MEHLPALLQIVFLLSLVCFRRLLAFVFWLALLLWEAIPQDSVSLNLQRMRTWSQIPKVILVILIILIQLNFTARYHLLLRLRGLFNLLENQSHILRTLNRRQPLDWYIAPLLNAGTFVRPLVVCCHVCSFIRPLPLSNLVENAFYLLLFIHQVLPQLLLLCLLL